PATPAHAPRGGFIQRAESSGEPQQRRFGERHPQRAIVGQCAADVAVDRAVELVAFWHSAASPQNTKADDENRSPAPRWRKIVAARKKKQRFSNTGTGIRARHSCLCALTLPQNRRALAKIVLCTSA